MPMLSKPYDKVELDEIGSFVWAQIDGKKNIYDICQIVKGHFGDKIEPVFDRVGKFFSYLKLSVMVEFKNES